MKKFPLFIFFSIFIILISDFSLSGQRFMEKLGRGVVAMRTSNDKVFISWRLLGTDSADITFNLYRDSVLIVTTEKTYYIDNTSMNSTYTIKSVIDSSESGVEGLYSMKTNTPIQQYFTIPLKQIGDFYVHYAWIGDLDGDGEYDYVISRHSNTDQTPKIEAYLRDGTYLWSIDMGHYSITQIDGNDNPPAAIGPSGNIAGYRDNDNITVYDLDLDGKAEVFVRTANGVIFGDSTVLNHENNSTQFISVIDGLSGTEKARKILPNNYISDGPLGGHMAVGYLDGIHPSLIYKVQNRKSNKDFNLMVYAFDYSADSLSLKWIFDRKDISAVEFHQIRILDVDDDGKDEICDGGYVVDNDGNLLYTLGKFGIGHGDRFHITDFDPDRPGLEGYGIQQDNPSCIAWYYYDAKTGNLIQSGYTDSPEDLGRGTTADIDPRYEGYEFWTYTDGIINSSTGKKITNSIPIPNFKIWWDGDLLGEMLNRTLINKWNYNSNEEERLLTGYKSGATYSWRNAPLFHGDIIGDWREEVIFEHYDHTELQIYTTVDPTEYRLYTLPHNPGYRNSLTCRGYLQSNLVDYYLGTDMDYPPQPNIRYIGDSVGCHPPVIVPYIQINNGKWYQKDSVLIDEGSDLKLLPHFIGTGSISWSGPNNFTDSSASITLTDLRHEQEGIYVVNITNPCEKSSLCSFYIKVTTDSINGTCAIQENDTGFCEVNGHISDEYQGFSGAGYAQTDKAKNKGISWTINIPEAGKYDLIWRYSNGSNNDLPAKIFVNNNLAIIGNAFIPTGAWDSWDYSSVNVNLKKDENIIRLESMRSQGLAYIDYLKTTGNNITPVYCYITNIDLVPIADNFDVFNTQQQVITVFPNPCNKFLIIEIKGKITDDIHISLFNSLGRLMIQKSINRNITTINLSDLPSGVYFLKYVNMNELKSVKLFKR